MVRKMYMLGHVMRRNILVLDVAEKVESKNVSRWISIVPGVEICWQDDEESWCWSIMQDVRIQQGHVASSDILPV